MYVISRVETSLVELIRNVYMCGYSGRESSSIAYEDCEFS